MKKPNPPKHILRNSLKPTPPPIRVIIEGTGHVTLKYKDRVTSGNSGWLRKPTKLDELRRQLRQAEPY